MRCYLHVGMEKTGSSSIQATLAQDRAESLRQGYLYPRSLGAVSHTNLIAYALEDERIVVVRSRALAAAGKDLAGFRPWLEKALVKEVRAAPAGIDIVCSSEHVQSALSSVSEKRRLKSLLDRVVESYQVIVYLRRQDEVARSRYSTALKSGATDLEPVLPEFDEVPYFYDYRRWLEEFIEVFGREALDVRLFDRDAFPGGDVTTDLLASIGYPGSETIRRASASNTSIDLDAQYFMSVYNRENPVRLRGRVNPRRGPIGDEIGELFPGPGRTVARSEAQAFLARFEDIDDWVRREFFPDRPELFSKDLSGYPETADVTYDMERVATIGARLLERRQERIDELVDLDVRGAARLIARSVRRSIRRRRHTS